MNTLVQGLIEFVDILRLGGIRISSSETIDAINGLEILGFKDKELVKYALCACLVKNSSDIPYFNSAFNLFFVPLQAKQSMLTERKSEIISKNDQITKNNEDLKFKEEQIDITPDLQATYNELSENEKQKIIDFLEKTSSGANVKSDFKPIVEKIIERKLQNIKNNSTNKEYVASIFDDGGLLAEMAQSEVSGIAALMKQNIDELKEKDLPKVLAIIKVLANMFKNEASRKFKKSSKRKKLDIRKTIRANLSTGGTLFKLKFKSKSHSKERFLMLCDVSASMIRFSGFVLQFILNMSMNISKLDGYIFAEQLEALKLSENFSYQGFDDYIRNSAVWGKGTDLANAIKELLVFTDNKISSSLIVIIVSDGKTLKADESILLLEKLKSKVKKIYWFNPIPVEKWKSIYKIGEFKRLTQMVDCSTLEKLSLANKSLR